MRTIVKLFLIIMSMSAICYADTHTCIADGRWKVDAATVWDTGIAPADGDTVLIDTSGEDVIYDEDMSNAVTWPNGVTLTIAVGASLTPSTTTGSYYLKRNGTMTINGTLSAGTSVSVPYEPNFTIQTGGNYGISVGIVGKVYLYCKEPTYKYIKLSGAEAALQTELSVDTNVTGDIWADGDEILICDTYPQTSLPEVESRTIAAGGIAAGTITITAGLTAEKKSGAYIVLVKRNIRILTPSTTSTYAFSINTESVGSIIYAEINGSGTGYRGLNYGCNFTLGGIIANYSSSSSMGVVRTKNSTFNGVIANCYSGTNTTTVCVYKGSIFGCNTATDAAISPIYYGCVLGGNAYGLANGDNIIVSDCTLDNTANIYRVANGMLFNTDFNSGTEFSGYNSILYRNMFSYLESTNHNGTDNATKIYDLGGIVTSQTTSPPTGYTTWYEHACESATYPCFRQWKVTVDPNETLIVTGFMRIAEANDLSANPPAFEIVDDFNDYLVDSSASPLARMYIPISNGTETGWQDMAISWTNTRASPAKVLVRTTATHATQQVDEAVTVPDIATQVSQIYVDLGDGGRIDLLIDSIKTDTGTTLPALINDVNDNIQTDLTTIIADTNEVQTDLADGGRLDTMFDWIISRLRRLIPN